METKPVNVGREEYAAMLENELLPAILTKFPDVDRLIKIQQDNARPHIPPVDRIFLEECEPQGLQVQMLS